MSSVCDYSDILAKRTVAAPNTEDAGNVANNVNKKIIFKNCALFIDSISEMNNTQIDNAKDLDVVTSMYNLKEYIDNYSKTSASLCQNYRDEPALTDAGVMDNFPGKSALLKFKQKITGQTDNDGTKDV